MSEAAAGRDADYFRSGRRGFLFYSQTIVKTLMPKVVVVQGLMEFTDGVWAVYVPDAEGVVGRGATRELAMFDAEMKLHRWLANERQARRKPNVLTETQFLVEDGVRQAMSLGMELVAIRL